MIIRQDKTFETSSMFLRENWYTDEDNFIIDETTDEGRQMANTYIKNYPFVDFEADENMVVTNVIILDKPERPPEVPGKKIVLKQDENGEYYYDYEDIPLTPKEKIQKLERDNINSMKAMVELHMKILELEGKL